MGKQGMISGAFAKIAKKRGTKMQVMTSTRHLTKAPRPKVYITDVADFRRLIQDLTGNPFAQSPCPPSLDTDAASRSEGSLFLDGWWEETASRSFSADMPLCHPGHIPVYMRQMNNDKMLNLADIESWLLETDSGPPCESYAQEISIYDYMTGNL